MLTLGGSGFVAGSVVQWNGAALTTTFVDAGTQLGSRLAKNSWLHPDHLLFSPNVPDIAGDQLPSSA